MKRELNNLFLLSLLTLLATAVGCTAEEEAEPEIIVATSSAEITLPASGETKVLATFSSAREWEACASEEWITLSATSGKAGDITLSAYANDENLTNDYRTGYIIISSLSVTATITVMQEPYVYLEQDTYNISAEGGEMNIYFSTNMGTSDISIYYKGSSAWMVGKTKEVTRDITMYYITLNVSANTGSERTGYLYFIRNSDEVQLATIKVVQESGKEEEEDDDEEEETVTLSSSEDYTYDMTYKQLQAHTQGNGIPIVLMGDGFLDTEIANGTYDKVMEQTMENLFSEEPITSLSDYFDVFMVYAVSENNRFGDGYSTVSSCEFDASVSTTIEGNNTMVANYTATIAEIDWKEALAVVVLNSTEYAGTTYFGFRTTGTSVIPFAVAYFPMCNGLETEMFRATAVHEAIGHGFGGLADEYYYARNGEISTTEAATLKEYQTTYGWFTNVDTTNNASSVLWAAFLSDSAYQNESIPLAIYEGGYTYSRGVYRPSYDSMMNNNVLGFNAPSRQILYNTLISRATGVTPTYEEFTAYDANHKPANVSTRTATQDYPHLPHPRITRTVLSPK